MLSGHQKTKTKKTKIGPEVLQHDQNTKNLNIDPKQNSWGAAEACSENFLYLFYTILFATNSGGLQQTFTQFCAHDYRYEYG